METLSSERTLHVHSRSDLAILALLLSQTFFERDGERSIFWLRQTGRRGRSALACTWYLRCTTILRLMIPPLAPVHIV